MEKKIPSSAKKGVRLIKKEGDDSHDLKSNAVDLIADILLGADALGFCSTDILRMAMEHYRAEKA